MWHNTDRHMRPSLVPRPHFSHLPEELVNWQWRCEVLTPCLFKFESWLKTCTMILQSWGRNQKWRQHYKGSMSVCIVHGRLQQSNWEMSWLYYFYIWFIHHAISASFHAYQQINSVYLMLSWASVKPYKPLPLIEKIYSHMGLNLHLWLQSNYIIHVAIMISCTACK